MRSSPRWRRVRRTRWLRGRALALASAAVAFTAGLVAPTSALAADVACSVTYTTNDWDSGFTANVSLRNDGAALDSWKVGWTFLDGQKVQQGWSATFAQTGAAVTATNLSYNGHLDTGASTSFGFNGSKGSANRPPTDFSVNGTACTGANKAPTVSLTAPASTGTYYAPATIPLAATAADSDGTVSKVEFYAGDTLLATDTAAPFEGSWASVPAGTYSITAKAYDNKNASTTSSPVSVKVLSGPTIVAAPATAQVKQGGTTTFAVTLAGAPTGSVTVGVARTAGSTDLTASPASLTFTTANWNTPQNVTVKSADNGGALGSATFTASSSGYTAATVAVSEISASTSDYQVEFLKQYNKIKDPNNGYFRKFGSILVPYHSIETLIVEAPDHGHETTSEAFSYYLWLEASYGRITGDWAPFNQAWTSIETYVIPSRGRPARQLRLQREQARDLRGGVPEPEVVPVAAADRRVRRQRPDRGRAEGGLRHGGRLRHALAARRRQHLRVRPLRGRHEHRAGVHQHLPARFAGVGLGDGPPAQLRRLEVRRQERLPRPVHRRLVVRQAVEVHQRAGRRRPRRAGGLPGREVGRRAGQELGRRGRGQEGRRRWATTCGTRCSTSTSRRSATASARRAAPAGTGKDSEHYLMSWYYAWGGSMDTSSAWAWRIGDGAAHQGYQNPLAAYALSTDPGLKVDVGDRRRATGRPASAGRWSSCSGCSRPRAAIAGGATNSWEGQYGTPPSGTPTFYGMFYDQQPV